MDIKSLAEKYQSYMVEMRRYFHEHPELSWHEFETTKAITKKLEAMGLSPIQFESGCGVMATIVGGKGGSNPKTIALRADIDALPVVEKTDLSFASQTEGVMHACGHDSHISMLLGAAKILTEIKDDLNGNVRLLFQAAEETAIGAKYFLDHGAMDGVSAVYGAHIWPDIPTGQISVNAGPVMASCDKFTIKVTGHSTHGSAPHTGIDATVVSAAIINNLQTIVSRENDPMNALVVTVGMIKSGTRFNIISGSAEMEGTTRTHNNDFRSTIEERITRIAKNTAEAMGATAEVDYEYLTSAVVNDDAFAEFVQESVKTMYGDKSVVNYPKVMGSEDFSYYMKDIPGAFSFVGTRNEALGITANIHNDKFTIDEDSLKFGASVHAKVAFDYLEKNK